MEMCAGGQDPRPARHEAIGERVRALALESGARPADHGFGFMFPALCGPAHRLTPEPRTLKDLARLAAAMAEPQDKLQDTVQDTLQDSPPPPRVRSAGDGDLPAAYTYLVEFLRNDLVWERRTPDAPGLGPDAFAPLPSLAGLLNRRSGGLDLDSIYDAPRDPQAVRRMLVGTVSPKPNGCPHGRPPRTGTANDLPRHPRSSEPGRDRAPRMSDARNDEHLILGQLHVAFLKAHNALIGSGLSFEAARRALRRRFQWMVLFDLLPKLCAPDVLENVMAQGPRLWRVERPAGLFMPVELSAAALVLAPSMRRASYDYNLNFRNVEHSALVTRNVLGGGRDRPETLPEHHVISWEGFLPFAAEAPQRARRLDTVISGAPESAQAVATHHLLRGFRLGLPTGQALARHLGLKPLKDDTLLAALPDHQRVAALPFCEATPLWFYILAEAGNPEGPAGRHLGPVGSRIVAEALWTLALHSDASILSQGSLPDFARFSLSDLILLAAEEDGR
ncbi:peroxidase family protein [Xanthobacter versatilis]|uniref:peroxidase family protein n=1 Tax=Xanthobacter autotrophicus (strain ATCC BAA-1158 / Py2) TaxID=78245 RepID=UPI00372B0C7A